MTGIEPGINYNNQKKINNLTGENIIYEQRKSR